METGDFGTSGSWVSSLILELHNTTHCKSESIRLNLKLTMADVDRVVVHSISVGNILNSIHTLLDYSMKACIIDQSKE